MKHFPKRYLHNLKSKYYIFLITYKRTHLDALTGLEKYTETKVMGSFDFADKRHSIIPVACFHNSDNKTYSLGRMLLLIICLILISLASKHEPHTGSQRKPTD